MSTDEPATSSLADRFEAAVDAFRVWPYDVRSAMRSDAFLYLTGYLGRAIRDDDLDAALLVRAFERAALECAALPVEVSA